MKTEGDEVMDVELPAPKKDEVYQAYDLIEKTKSD